MDRAVKLVERVPPQRLSVAATVPLATAEHHHTLASVPSFTRTTAVVERQTIQPPQAGKSVLTTQTTQVTDEPVLISKHGNLKAHLCTLQDQQTVNMPRYT